MTATTGVNIVVGEARKGITQYSSRIVSYSVVYVAEIEFSGMEKRIARCQ